MRVPGQPSRGSAVQSIQAFALAIQWFISWVYSQVHRSWTHRMSRRLQWNMSINKLTWTH